LIALLPKADFESEAPEAVAIADEATFLLLL
jgi:hypothetical protein